MKVLDYIIALGDHAYVWGVTGQNPLLLKHTNSQSAKCACNEGRDAPSMQT